MCPTGSGPGCPDLGSVESSLSSSSMSSSDVDVVYYYEASRGGELSANVSCRRRDHVFAPQPLQPNDDDGIWPHSSSISVHCVGFVWSEPVPTRCVG